MNNSINLEVDKVIFPPNKPMDRNLSFSVHPKLYSTLLFLDFNNEGMLFSKKF